MRQIIENGRRSAAMISSLSQSAYQNTSQRFAALQQLITMIGATGDMKAIQDLQGRISSEQAMLQNEQTKLQTLYQMAQADQWAQQQRIREQSATDVGSVNSLAPVSY
jgi:type IV secretion system protein VirB5